MWAAALCPSLGRALMRRCFRLRFEAKEDPPRRYLSEVPVWVITAQTPALLGASYALDFEAEELALPSVKLAPLLFI